MGTRCGVFYQTQDGKLKGTEITHDGYLSGVGATLAVHYASYDKISALVDKSAYYSALENTLSKTIAETGESNLEPHEHEPYMTRENNLLSLLKWVEDSDWEYVYVFINGKWLWSNDDYEQGEKKFRPFKELTLDDINKD